jgi:hypothetical protein
MRYLLPILTFLLASTSLVAQFTLTGKLIDQATNETVGFATVYLDGTSIGDISADDGTFRLRIPAGREQDLLIVSHVNYKTSSVILSADQPVVNLMLQPKAATLTRIEVGDDDFRAENLIEFHNRLIGRDVWGKNASVENESVIRFDRDFVRREVNVRNEFIRNQLKRRNHRNAEWSEDGNTFYYDAPQNLKASTTGALLINLNDTGYKLRMDLNRFQNSYRTKRMSYLGSSFYIPDTLASPRQQKKYARNRLKAYYGSSMHFIRSLLADELDANGFMIVEVVKEATLNKPPQTRPVNLRSHLNKREDGNYEFFGTGDRKFAVLFYSANGYRPIPMAERRGSAQPVQSRMWLLAGASLIHPTGTLMDTNLVFSGDIGERGLAWSLPADFVPE